MAFQACNCLLLVEKLTLFQTTDTLQAKYNKTFFLTYNTVSPYNRVSDDCASTYWSTFTY